MTSLYTDADPYVCSWLENLRDGGHLPPGRVVCSPVSDLLEPLEETAHFFAGIGGWPHALELVGWPPGVPIWTGSCPCQPFSSAGKRHGTADERHVWPAWFKLISRARPWLVVGEQVSSPDALAWWDVVSDDLEREGYACAAADLCAASVGAPHIRQRLFWMAVADGERREGFRLGLQQRRPHAKGAQAGRHREGGRMGDALSSGRERAGEASTGVRRYAQPTSHWDRYAWIDSCGKSRPIEPGTPPLVAGFPGRVGQVRAYGNALVPQVAAAFLESVIKVL